MSRNGDPEGGEPQPPGPSSSARVFDGIFRCYAVVIAFFVVLAETEWGFIIKFWKDIVLLQNIASYLLLACGVVYVFSFRVMLLKLGCKCCAGYRDSYALACSNIHARKRKLQGNKQLEIWRNWRDEEKNLNKCC
ncbi:hypothetical protein F3Y22_tig00109925pilonHSYRG00081 [Hibiscus syriacus]|uniref:Uncharacterized protein n=1 Tax=Hibiscus syriacus TaxID=106335 RepID=A0A6A3BT47_HIBSY|nr:hypothetical protein F3Y22_tig00109925pilonHSYRG00081 [Hibiscus syriacus]